MPSGIGWIRPESRNLAAQHVDQRRRHAFADDLDTPRAIVSLRQLDKNPDVADGAKFATFSAVDALLGLDLLRDVGRAPRVAEVSEEAQGLLDRRAAARAAKDWAQSDELRDVLADMGVVVKDTAEGQQVVT